MNETHTVFFMGKPGSGKGTQSKILSEKTGWPIVSTSDGLRALAGEDSAVGRKLTEEMNAGILTPSWLPMYVFIKSIFGLKADQSVIFDGFSRKLAEGETVSEVLEWVERPYVIFHLSVSDDEVRNRVAIRKGIEGRADDDMIDKRFEQYYAHTEPSIEFFRKKGVVVELNGEKTPEEIAAEVCNYLKI